jgi:flagellum-specific ATP synthase
MRTATEKLDLLSLTDGLEKECAVRVEGRVVEVIGLTVKSIGPRISVGDFAWIETGTGNNKQYIPAEVVGFRDRFVLLMPVEHLHGIRPGARVIPGGRLQVNVGYSLLGRIVDGIGRPIDQYPELKDTVSVDVQNNAPDPLKRRRLNEVFVTGISALDALLTSAKGQRLGIFSGSGVGKSVLLGSLARNSSATVNVISLIGERGREVRNFVEESIGEDLSKSVVVAATSDQSPLMRIRGASTAMAIAEYYRNQGENVLLLMDSITRYAMAQREIGLAAGEPPTTKGYPPSVFGQLARLLERSGNSENGSITAFYTVLVEGDDLNDPIADAVRAILDGHIVLSRELAEMNHYPAIDVLQSVSRAMNQVISEEHRNNAGKLRSLLSVYKKAEDIINVGAYVRNSNPKIDEALDKHEKINKFLCQRQYSSSDWQDTLKGLAEAIK